MCHVFIVVLSCVRVSCVMCPYEMAMYMSGMCHVSCVMCHVSCHLSCVMCHVSCVICHVSCVMCHVSGLSVLWYVDHMSWSCVVSYVMCHMLLMSFVMSWWYCYVLSRIDKWCTLPCVAIQYWCMLFHVLLCDMRHMHVLFAYVSCLSIS
jgi:hypothetical protein